MQVFKRRAGAVITLTLEDGRELRILILEKGIGVDVPRSVGVGCEHPEYGAVAIPTTQNRLN